MGIRASCSASSDVLFLPKRPRSSLGRGRVRIQGLHFSTSQDNTTAETCCGLVDKSRSTLATPWIIAQQVPLSMGFSRQEYWSRLSFFSPVDLPDLGNEPGSPALQVDSLLTEPPGNNKAQGTRLSVSWQLGWEGAWGRMDTCTGMA